MTFEARTSGRSGDSVWRSTARAPRLDADAVHVWRARLDLEPAGMTRCERLLSAEERQRAARYRSQRDRRRFTVGRATVRRILAGYSGLPPSELVFEERAHGKPRLTIPRPRFNISHADEMLILAVCEAREVGADVERAVPVAVEELVTRFFSLRERAEFAAVPPSERLGWFFDVWTLKEAYLKALGTGLSKPLASFSVASRGVPAAASLSDAADPGAEERWQLRRLPVGSGFSAALVVERPPPRLVLLEWGAAEVAEEPSAPRSPGGTNRLR